MSNIMPTPATPQQNPQTTETAKAADPSTTSNAAAANTSQGYTAATKIKSLEDLKKKAPKLYEKMMEGIAMSMIRSNQRIQNRIKEKMREARSK